MSKLIYRTKPPKKGFVFNESMTTHEGSPLPPSEIRRQALTLVDDSMRHLARKLEELGYDPTKIRFQIYYKQ